MIKLQKYLTLDALVSAMLPIAFIGAGFLNMWAFVLDGHRHNWFRQGLVIGVQAIAAALFLVKVISLFRNRGELRKPILAVAGIPVVFAVIHLMPCVMGADMGAILKSAVISGGYLTSLCLAAIIIFAEQSLVDFLRTFRIYSIVLSPVVVYYCVRFYLPDAQYGVENLGVFSYMPLAYCLMQCCIALLLKTLFEKSSEKNSSVWVDFAIYTLFAVAITLSGTKGAILCLLWGGCLFFVYALIKRDRKGIFIQYITSAALSVAIFSTALAPNYGVENRVVSFLKELVTPESVEMSMEDIHASADIVQKVEPPADVEQTTPPDGEQTTPPDGEQTTPPDGEQTTPPDGEQTTPPDGEQTTPPDGEQTTPPDEEPPSTDKPLTESVDVVAFVNSGKAAEALAAGEISQEEYDQLKEMTRKLNNTATGGRKMLWMQALSEIKVSPLVGQGPYFYQMKYGTYPHNLFLEVATDFGVPAMLLIAVFGAYVFFVLIKKSMNNPYIAAFMLLVFSYLPQKMISGSLYDYSVFFQYGGCVVVFVLLCCNVRKDKKYLKGEN